MQKFPTPGSIANKLKSGLLNTLYNVGQKEVQMGQNVINSSPTLKILTDPKTYRGGELANPLKMITDFPFLKKENREFFVKLVKETPNEIKKHPDWDTGNTLGNIQKVYEHKYNDTAFNLSKDNLLVKSLSSADKKSATDFTNYRHALDPGNPYIGDEITSGIKRLSPALGSPGSDTKTLNSIKAGSGNARDILNLLLAQETATNTIPNLVSGAANLADVGLRKIRGEAPSTSNQYLNESKKELLQGLVGLGINATGGGMNPINMILGSKYLGKKITSQDKQFMEQLRQQAKPKETIPQGERPMPVNLLNYLQPKPAMAAEVSTPSTKSTKFPTPATILKQNLQEIGRQLPGIVPALQAGIPALQIPQRVGQVANIIGNEVNRAKGIAQQYVKGPQDLPEYIARYLMPNTIDYTQNTLQDIGAGNLTPPTLRELATTATGPLGMMIAGTPRQKQQMAVGGELYGAYQLARMGGRVGAEAIDKLGQAYSQIPNKEAGFINVSGEQQGQTFYRAVDSTNKSGAIGKGTYFVQDPQNATRYGKNIQAFKVSPDAKLLDLSDPQALSSFQDDAVRQFRTDFMKAADKEQAVMEITTKAAKALGYDGIIGDDSAFGTVIFNNKVISNAGPLGDDALAQLRQQRGTPLNTDEAITQTKANIEKLKSGELTKPTAGSLEEAKVAQPPFGDVKQYPDSTNNPLYQEMRSAQDKLTTRIQELQGKYKTDAEMPVKIKTELENLKSIWQDKAKAWEKVYSPPLSQPKGVGEVNKFIKNILKMKK